MDQYTIRITAQAREHLKLIRDYIAVDLREPEIAKNYWSCCKKKYPRCHLCLIG